MTKKHLLFAATIGCMILSHSALAQERPNILFILCDDLGYGDMGVFYQNSRGNDQPKIKTPHIDQLAKDGMQLRAHYVAAPVCAPSRASLFLGQSQGNAPVRDNQFDKALPDQPTLASTLQQSGYHTGLVGKWGLQGKAGKKAKNSRGWPSYPTKRGFDYYFGSVAHRDGHEHYPYDLVHFKKKGSPVPVWEQDMEISKDLKGCYSTDLFTAASKKFIVEHQKNSPDKPFFLMLSYDTPHAATQIATMPYPKGFGVNGGIQWVGKSGKMINTAGGKVDSYVHPNYTDKDWKDVSKRYASSIQRIDNSVADLVQTLKDLKQDENTLIIFSSDHGPSQESYIKERLDPSFFQSFGPFTGIKRDCWEGGIRPGAIAKWPAVIKAGAVTEAASQMQDWMPTFCDIAGVSVPALADGVSILPTLSGKTGQKESKIYVEYNVGGATPKYRQFPQTRAGQKRGQLQVVRVGDLKAVRYNIKSATDPFLVFDVVKDPAEAKNLAGKEGLPDQKYWLDIVSRQHHKNKSAKRPYDGLEVASLLVKAPKQGVKVIPAKESKASYISRDSFQITGFIKVDEAGAYKFSLPEGVKGILRIHSLSVLDTASKERYPNDNTLKLSAGYHPFTLYLAEKPKQTDVLMWQVGDVSAQAIPIKQYFH